MSDIPVIVFTGRESTAEEDAHLHSVARSIVVKDVESPERLLDETAIFLHRVVAELPPEKQLMLEKLTPRTKTSSTVPCFLSTTIPEISLL